MSRSQTLAFCVLPLSRLALSRSIARRVNPVFFFNDTATTEIYTLSLHDALPICASWVLQRANVHSCEMNLCAAAHLRSEEHTSELQSPCNLVCRLLLEKKKDNKAHRRVDKSENLNISFRSITVHSYH